jgi:hypothetical protein
VEASYSSRHETRSRIAIAHFALRKVNCLVLVYAENIAMNGAQEEAVDEQEGQTITAIREALRGTAITVTRNVDFDHFPDILSDSVD